MHIIDLAVDYQTKMIWTVGRSFRSSNGEGLRYG